MTISGSASDAPPLDAPAAVTVIDLERERGPGRGASLASLLEGELGVQVRSQGGLGQFSGVLLRGASSSEVAVFLDGVPLSRGGQAAVDLSGLPIEGLERVEIYRGLPPPELGMDAIGGAINLVTRRGGPQSQKSRAARLRLSTGSFGLRQASAGAELAQGGLRATASLAYQGATGDFPYFDAGGLVYAHEGQGGDSDLRRRNDGFDQIAATVRASLTRGRLDAYVQGQGLLKQQGVPGRGQAGAQPGHPDLGLARAVLSAGGVGRLLAGRLALTLDAHALLDRSLFRYLDVDPPTRFETFTLQLGVRAGAGLAVHRAVTLRALAELRAESLQTSDLCPWPALPPAVPTPGCAAAAPTRSDRQRLLAGLSGDVRLPGDRLLFQPGVQLLGAWSRLLPVSGSVALQGPEKDRHDLFVAPRLGLRLRLRPGLVVRASAGRFVRLPTFLELFGDRAFFRENPELRPESAWSAEAGVRAAGCPFCRRWPLELALEASAFARFVDDLIETLRDGPVLRARNVGSARMLGGEAELRAALGGHLALRLGYTLLVAQDLTDLPGRAGNRLPGRPEHALFLRAEAAYGSLRLFYELDHASLLYLDPANLQPRPERTLHALGLSLGPHGRAPAQLALSIEVRNLLDTRVLTVPLPLGASGRGAVALSDFHDYPLPGRSLYAALEARF